MLRWLPKARSRPPRIVWGLDAQQLAWRQAQDAPLQTAPHNLGISEALACANAGSIGHVIVANDLAVHWLQTPPASVQSFDELRLVARARCAHLYGGTQQDWWVGGDWTMRTPFVCAALPRAVVDPVLDRAKQRGIDLHWHTAWGLMSGARAASFPDDGWSALRSPRRIVYWHCRSGKINALSAMPIDASASDEEGAQSVRQHVHLESLHDQSLASEALQWVNLGQARDLTLPDTQVAEAFQEVEAAAALNLSPLLGAAAR